MQPYDEILSMWCPPKWMHLWVILCHTTASLKMVKVKVSHQNKCIIESLCATQLVWKWSRWWLGQKLAKKSTFGRANFSVINTSWCQASGKNWVFIGMTSTAQGKPNESNLELQELYSQKSQSHTHLWVVWSRWMDIPNQTLWQPLRGGQMGSTKTVW